MKHTSDFGSQIAKNGFKNEKDVISKFNNWEVDKDAQGWLEEMGYDLTKINKIEAIKGAEAKLRLIEQGMKFDSGNVKTDVSVLVTIHLKNMVEPQNISVKLVTAKYNITKKSYSGFNQIDKREVDNYTKLWNMPETIVKTLKYFTGKISPYINNARDKRRMYLNEMKPKDVKELVDFFDTHDMGEYESQMPEVEFEIDLKRDHYLVSVDGRLMSQLLEAAQGQQVSVELLVDAWLKKKLLQAS